MDVKKDSNLAWLVCLGAFITLFATIGIDTSFGVVMGSLMELLESNAYKVSWIQSVHSSLMFVFAFVSSIMLKRFSFRRVVLIGTILCSTSYLVSAFLQNYAGLFILYGVIGGAGSGLLYTTSNIACAHYFDKWKALSTGLSMTGAGIGTMGVSWLGNYVNIRYGCRGYFILLFMIASLTMVFALFLSPIRNDNRENDNKEEKKQQTYKTLGSELQDKTASSMTNHKTILDFNYDENKPKVVDSPINIHGRRRSIIASNQEIVAHDEARQDRRSSINENALINALKEYHTEPKPEAQGNGKVRNILILLNSKTMILYCMVHVMFELAYYVPIVYLPEMMMKDHGISRELAGTILSVFGFCHITGKILTGLIVQYLTISPIMLAAASIGLLGISSICFAFCSTYVHFVIVTAAYGSILASFGVLTPLVVIEIVGDEKLKDGFGLVMIAKMVSTIWGPPIGGALKDWSGNYNSAFYASGTFHIIGAFLNILVCLFHFNVFSFQAKYVVFEE